MNQEQQYLDLLQNILDNGIKQSNRTGIDCFTLPGAMLKFDLALGFPAITTKKLFFDKVKAELVGFIRGYSSAADFRALGCDIWDANANENKAWLENPARRGKDDLGRVYGVQWRDWMGRLALPEDDPKPTAFFMMADGIQKPLYQKRIDQLTNAINLVKSDPGNRRNIVTTWNPAELDQMALPPCHLLFQLIPHSSTGKLHMTMYQRSCDMFIGVPFNIASYALLLSIIARWTGYAPGTLTMFLADVHIYENHIDQVKQQLDRTPMPFPTLELATNTMDDYPLADLITRLEPRDMYLVSYQSHAAIRAPMAI